MQSVRPPTRRRGTAAAAAVLAAILAVPLAGCGGSDPSDVAPSAGAGDRRVPVVPEMGHVHGLGTNPQDGRLYVATHSGVFVVPDDADPARVADRHQDTMGFTVAGPDRFLASGHPDLEEAGMPPHLGLIESRDAAATWAIRSLSGQADFHALDVGPSRVFGYDGLTGRILASTDLESWRPLGSGPVIDLAADPVLPGRVLATTAELALVAYQMGADEPAPMPSAPALVFVDWPHADLLVGVDAAGTVHRSRDGGASWQAIGEPLGLPQAVDVTAEAWYVATETAVLRSDDEGGSWRPVVAFG